MTMKKFSWILAICVAATVTSCGNASKEAESKMNHERDSLMKTISQRDAELDEMMDMVNEINEGFRQINDAQGRVIAEQSNGEGPNMRTQIQENLQFIQQTMQQNRDQIAKLKANLQKSSLSSTKLKETIQQLTAQLEEKDQQMEALRAELASKHLLIEEQTKAIEDLTANVTSLTEQNEEQSKQVAAQDKALNTAWFVFGTKSELKEQKILEKGDVLKSGNFNKDYFTQIDIRNQKEIKLYSKSANILTNHPKGSYTLEKDAKGQYVLKITNANEFWSVSRYLVVQVK